MKIKIRRALATHLQRRVVPMHNQEPLVSFTFDDFPRSAWTQGGTVLADQGFKGTFFASLGLMGSCDAGEVFCADDLHKLIKKGHELGCHTYDHCHAWDTRPSEFEASIIRNREALENLLPGKSFRSFSYPISCPRPETKRRVSKYFESCRGGGQTFNARVIDLNFVKSCFLEQAQGDFGLVSTLIDANVQAAGWLIFTTHDVSENPTRFGCTRKFFERIVRRAAGSGATVVTMWEGLNRIRNTSHPSYAFSSPGMPQPGRHRVSSIV